MMALKKEEGKPKWAEGQAMKEEECVYLGKELHPEYVRKLNKIYKIMPKREGEGGRWIANKIKKCKI